MSNHSSHDPIVDDNEARLRFWTRRLPWGLNLPEHVFLGDAVILAGRKLFPSDWADQDPAYRIFPDLSRWYNIETDTWMIRRACELLAKHDEGYRERVGHVDLSWNLQFPSQGEWQRAVELDQLDKTNNTEMADRFTSICRELCGLFQTNIVATFARPVRGGEPVQLSNHVWFTEVFWQRFSSCRLNADDPFSVIAASGMTDFIYVHRAAFLGLIEASDPIPAQTAENEKTTAKDIEKIKRGRPPEYDCDGFNQEVVRRIAANGKPDNVRAFANDMLQWCGDTWGAEPGESTVRGRIAKLLAINSEQH